MLDKLADGGKLTPEQEKFITELVTEFKPTVSQIEAKYPTTKGHYGDYMALLSTLTDNPKRIKIYGMILKKAGANPSGVNAAVGLLTGSEFADGGPLQKAQPVFAFEHKGEKYYTLGKDNGEKPHYSQDEIDLLKQGYVLEGEYNAARKSREQVEPYLDEIKKQYPLSELILSHSPEFFGFWRIWSLKSGPVATAAGFIELATGGQVDLDLDDVVKIESGKLIKVVEKQGDKLTFYTVPDQVLKYDKKTVKKHLNDGSWSLVWNKDTYAEGGIIPMNNKEGQHWERLLAFYRDNGLTEAQAERATLVEMKRFPRLRRLLNAKASKMANGGVTEYAKGGAAAPADWIVVDVMYRDGANYKYFVENIKVPKEYIATKGVPKPGDELEMEDLGYSTNKFYALAGVKEVDEEIDHNILEVLEVRPVDFYDPVYEAEPAGALDYVPEDVPEEDRWWMEKGGGLDYKGVKYPTRKLVIVGHDISKPTQVVIGTQTLESELRKSKWRGEARKIDSGIYFYVSDDLIGLPEQELAHKIDPKYTIASKEQYAKGGGVKAKAKPRNVKKLSAKYISPASNFDLRIHKILAQKILAANPKHPMLKDCDIMCKEMGNGTDWVSCNKSDLVNGKFPDTYSTFEVWITGEMELEKLKEHLEKSL